MINPLSNLLERFSKNLNKNTETKNAIIDTIKNKTRAVLDYKSINLKDGVLEIEASPSAKNEIKLKEDEIKKELKISRIFYK